MGVADDIINAGYPLDYPRDTLYVTSLNGFVLGRDPLPGKGSHHRFLRRGRSRALPAARFDRLMAGKVLELGMTQVLYGSTWRLMSEDAEGVTSVVEARTAST